MGRLPNDRRWPTQVACRVAGVTYRQADYWLRRGWVRIDDPEPGTGTPRTWSRNAIVRLTILSAAAAAGLSPGDVAAAIDGNEWRPALGMMRQGLLLRLDPDGGPAHWVWPTTLDDDEPQFGSLFLSLKPVADRITLLADETPSEHHIAASSGPSSDQPNHTPDTPIGSQRTSRTSDR